VNICRISRNTFSQILLRRKSVRPPSGMKKRLNGQETFVAVKRWDAAQSISMEVWLQGAPAALFYNIDPTG
jgi:hypothetical protein